MAYFFCAHNICTQFLSINLQHFCTQQMILSPVPTHISISVWCDRQLHVSYCRIKLGTSLTYWFHFQGLPRAAKNVKNWNQHHLQQWISDACAAVEPDMLCRVRRNTILSLQTCLEVVGGHVDQILRDGVSDFPAIPDFHIVCWFDFLLHKQNTQSFAQSHETAALKCRQIKENPLPLWQN